MGQKTNPIGNRLGYIRGWDSNWFADKEYAANVIEDAKLREYIDTRIEKGGIARVIIERTLKRITLTIHTSRPGIIIGKGGKEIDLLREELRRLTKKDIQINIIEIRKPELDANIVAESVAKQIEARINYRRAIKTSIAATMRASAEGIKIRISGRLNGSDMSRTEEFKEGRTPLHTFRADIDYAHKEAHTVYGRIGIKVWLCKGEVLGKRDLNPNAGLATKGNDRRGGDRGGRGGRDGGGRRGGNDRRGGGGRR
ncbi:30S ribosomal protein S3 [Neolewinella persica]|uniref:30S ribosomal protein S3 n=1 Tax=Neolewinella persica TaxID=70998 RepID=UPI00037D446D|nr:30S ribosomal protein S3 [Neolewinella persica]